MVNGTADSIMTAELSNWSGKAIKIPRTEIQTCSRDDVNSAGVYLLFCQDDDGSSSVYIGEAENIIVRLRQHLQEYKAGKEKFYWNTAVIFIGRDLNKALIRYIEDKLVKSARECGRYRVLTKNTYDTSIKESLVATMEEFIDNIKILISTMNYNVFVPVPKAEDDTQYFFCNSSKSEAAAKGFVSPGGFTVLKGSKVSERIYPVFEGHNYHKLRLQLENDGVISDGIFQRDYEFNSPSAASAVVLGRSSNGNVEWRTKDSVKLKDI